MKKLSFLLTLMFMNLFLYSQLSSNELATHKQTMTQSVIVGEWKCVDIVAGTMHMKSIAKMQPHMVFSNTSKIYIKQKLSNGHFMKQKYANYKIENGVLSSKVFDVNPYIENKQLIIENPSEDNKRIYTKIGK